MHTAIDRIRYYYEANMGEGQPDYSILGWESEKAQLTRFEMLASHVELQDKKLLDVGCGVGNLAEYLFKKDVRVDYTGVDILDIMIEKALAKNLPARFVHCDIFKDCPPAVERFDIVYASGIFNLNLNNNMQFLSKAIRTFLELSTDKIVFNLLGTKSPDKEDKYFYYDMEEVSALIQREFSGEISDIRVIDEYLHNDFTVICTKRTPGKA